jgi:type I restriction enzyme M protein
LNIPLYVDTSEEEEEIDLDAVRKEIEELEAKLGETREQIRLALKELRL